VAPSVQRRKVWLTPTTRVPCSNAAKMRNPLKFAWVPQTCQHISAVNRPKFAILSKHVKEVLLFSQFFPIVDICLNCEDTARQTCAMMRSWTQSEFCTWQNSARGKELPKIYIPPKIYIQYTPGQDMAERSANFGRLLLSDVAAITKTKRENR